MTYALRPAGWEQAVPDPVDLPKPLKTDVIKALSGPEDQAAHCMDRGEECVLALERHLSFGTEAAAQGTIP